MKLSHSERNLRFAVNTALISELAPLKRDGLAPFLWVGYFCDSCILNEPYGISTRDLQSVLR
jgi:hypothetical protein